MFIVSVCLRSSPTTLQFTFKDFMRAGQFRAELQKRRAKTDEVEATTADAWSLELRDDYGHIFDIMLEEVGAIVLKDVNESNKAGMELGMLNARAQMELNSKVQSDPKMRFLQGQIQMPRQ